MNHTTERPHLVLTFEEWERNPDLRALQKLRAGLIDQAAAIEAQIAGVDTAIRVLREQPTVRKRE